MKRISLEQAYFDALKPFGRVGASFPVYFSPPPEHEIIANAELLDRERLGSYFARSIAAWSQNPSEEDQRAAASRFTRRYAGAVATAGLVALAQGVAFDVSIPRLSLIIRNELPLGAVIDLAGATVYTCDERPTTWPIQSVPSSQSSQFERVERLKTVVELREAAFRSLFAENLAPAFERVRELVHVSPKLLWTNAAESIELLYEYGMPPAHDEAAWRPYAEDREAIHHGETMPGLGANPMRGLVEWDDLADVPGVGGLRQTRRVCCTNYVIPGRPSPYCRTCGLLTLEQRREAWRAYAEKNANATQMSWPPEG